LADFLDRAHRSASGKVSFPLLDEDGVQVNGKQAVLGIKLSRYNPIEANQVAIDTRGLVLEKGHQLGQDGRYKKLDDLEVEAAGMDNQVWVAFRGERPIKVTYNPGSMVDDFERSTLEELRQRFGPRIFSIAVQKVHRVNPRTGTRPPAEILPSNESIESAVSPF
jgi:hypothetical protein